ncbi:hypothetical protein ACJRPK_13900 [Aquimarina sp. 2-A2]|uniref:hypothetical protein n=1 Tax=Aquimarina sp. 2-A2 TaxID=3382644 RepID=UPI00387F362C
MKNKRLKRDLNEWRVLSKREYRNTNEYIVLSNEIPEFRVKEFNGEFIIEELCIIKDLDVTFLGIVIKKGDCFWSYRTLASGFWYCDNSFKTLEEAKDIIIKNKGLSKYNYI